MKIFKNLFRSKEDAIIDNLSILGKNFTNGISKREEFYEWEKNINSINNFKGETIRIEIIKNGFNELFMEYLLKHYPEDKRLIDKYINRDCIDCIREGMYVDYLLKTLGNALFILKFDFQKYKGFDSSKKDQRDFLISKIEKYVYLKNNNREFIHIKEYAGTQTFYVKNLECVLHEVFNFIPYKTSEQIEWHLQACNISSFKLDYDSENIFRKRYRLSLKHGLLIGSLGSGKTSAVQKEIENILKYTNDSVIVIDNDGLYRNFCEKYNVEYINLYENPNFFEKDFKDNKILILDIFNNIDIDNPIKLKYAKKALEFAYRKINNQNNTWVYIDEMNELLTDNYFLEMTNSYSQLKVIVTVVTTKFTKLDTIDLNFKNIGYIRILRQLKHERKYISDFFEIEPELLEFNDIKKSIAILDNNVFRITEDNIENQKIEVEKQTIKIRDLKEIMYCENALLIGETGSLAYPLFRYLMWLEDRNILWVDKESEKIFFELHKDKKPNPSVDFKTVEQFNKDKGINDFKSYSRIYLNEIDNIETVHAAQISIKNKPTTVRTQNPEYGLFLKEYYDTILIFNPNSENGKKKIIKAFQEHNIELENEVESFNEINEAIILWRDVISKDIRKNFIIIDIDFDPEFPLNVTI